MIVGEILLFTISAELLTHGSLRFGGDISDDPGVNTISFSTFKMPECHSSSYTPLSSSLIITLISIVIVIGIGIGIT